MWLLTTTPSRKNSETSLKPNCVKHIHRNPKIVGNDATTDCTNTAANNLQQQLIDIEMGESSDSSGSTQEAMQQLLLDDEYMCMDVSSTYSCSSDMAGTATHNSIKSMNSNSNIARCRNKKATATISIRVFSCFYCKDMIHTIASRSFYSVASISMIIMNKSIDKR